MLARLRFEPQTSDEFNSLITGQNASSLRKPQVSGLTPLMNLTASANTEAGTGLLSRADALTSVRAAVNALSAQQVASIASATSLDSDGDGLTDTQESWWCTDPMQPNSNPLSTLNDGQKVQQTLDWMANRRSGPPDQRPFTGWPMIPTDGHFNPNCVDGDHDGVPDMAERWVLGLNPNAESTTGDKFDDGQKLFGITPPNWGARPRPQDATVIGNEMPNWVGFPGRHPMVAAYPSLSVNVIPTFTVQLVTNVTTEQNHSQNESRTYNTSTTEGTTTSSADTKNWNEWEEVSEAVEQKILPARPAASNLGIIGNNALYDQSSISSPIQPSKVSAETAVVTKNSTQWIVSPAECSELEGTVGGTVSVGGSLGVEGVASVNGSVSATASATVKPNSVWADARCRQYLVSKGMISDTVPPDYSGVLSNGFDGLTRATTQAGELMANRLSEIGNILKAPSKTNTTTKAKGTGGATTDTHEQHEDHTVNNGQQWGTTQGWSNATAVDSSHAADFWFTYRIRNDGTDYAMAVTQIAFNIYIGDDSNPVCTYYVGSDTCGTPPAGGGALFTNLGPGSDNTLTAHHIPLTLEQVKTIDLGGKIRVVLEKLNYGIDELFYQNARAGSVLVSIEDGTDDGDESVDNYLIPTWGSSDTMQDIMSRYFPGAYDADGNYSAIWTPENRQDTPAWCVEPRRTSINQLWCKRALSTASWWNVFFSGLGDGTSQLKDTPAYANGLAFFRFDSDSDQDGFSDLTERRLGTSPFDATSRPQSNMIAGVKYQTPVNNVVTATLSLLNTGLQDAAAVEATMIAPDDSITILERSVGGTGRVNGLKSVVVGGEAKLPVPLPGTWQQSQHAKPVVSGYYAGAGNRVYTFTVICSTNCQIGSGSLQLGWNDTTGASGSIIYGAGYASPTPMNVGTSGVQLGMLSGAVTNGEFFTMTATAPTDVFSFRINREPHTSPIVIVQYSNPEGKHRVVTPIELTNPAQDLAPFGSSLMADIGVEIVTTQTFGIGLNHTSVVVNNPSGKSIVDAHLYMQFVNISGTVVSQVPLTLTVPPGPYVIDVPWITANFSGTYQPGKPYIVMAYLTDYQGYTVAKTGRVLSTFQDDPRSKSVIATSVWDFGTVVAGEKLKARVGIASIGFYDLLLSSVDVNGEGLTASLLGATTVAPTTYREVEVTLDTQGLSSGQYHGLVSVRTNDVTSPTMVIRVTGSVQNPSSGLTVLSNDPSRPLSERVYVPGGLPANTIVSYTSQLAPAQTTPLYLLNSAGSVVGRGLNVLQAPPTQLLRSASASPELSATAPDLNTQPNQATLQPEAVAVYQVEVHSLGGGFESTWQGGWVRVNTQNSISCSTDSGNLIYTTTRYPGNSTYSDWARWRPMLSVTGRYKVEVYIPQYTHTRNVTDFALYTVSHMDGATNQVRSQNQNQCNWTDLGTHRFSSGNSGNVFMGDYTGDNPQRLIATDAMRFTLQAPDTPDLYGISNPEYDEYYTVDWSDAFGAADGYTLQEWNGSSWYDIAYPGDSYLNISNHAVGDYCYRVLARNASGYSGWSGNQCVSVRPVQGTPTLYAISNSGNASNYTVQWSWIDWTTQFYLQEKLNNGSYNEVYRGTATSWSTTNRSAGQYCYRVIAQNARNTSGYSGEQCVLVDTPPNSPVNLLPADGQAVLGRQLSLGWQDGGDPDNAPLSYRKYQGEVQNQNAVVLMTMPLTTSLAWNPVVPNDGL